MYHFISELIIAEYYSIHFLQSSSFEWSDIFKLSRI